jgi:hypothetical protein
LVEEDLLHHAVGALRVLDCSVQNQQPGSYHDRKHDRVVPVEGVLLDQECQDNEGHEESRKEQGDGVPLKQKITRRHSIVALSCSLELVHLRPACGGRERRIRSAA